jgi:hypothetical protein
MMQAASDIYLGWTEGAQTNRWLYGRQLRDMKGSALVESQDYQDFVHAVRSGQLEGIEGV